MGLIIGFIFLLIGKISGNKILNANVLSIPVIQMMMPRLRQMMDFFTAVYAPYGDDEYAEGRYDDYNYHDDFKPYTQQFRGVSHPVSPSCIEMNIFSSMGSTKWRAWLGNIT